MILSLADFGLSLADFGLSLADFGLSLEDFGMNLEDFGSTLHQLRKMMMMMLTNFYWLTLEDFWIEEGVEAEAEAEGAVRSMHWYHHAAEKAAEKRRSS